MIRSSDARRDAVLGLRVSPTLLLSSVLLNLLAIALPIFTLQVYDRVIPNAATDTLLLLASLLFVVLLGESALRMMRHLLASWAGARFEHSAGCAAIERLLGADLKATAAETTGTHLERLAAVDRLRDFYASQGATILIDLPFAAVFAAVIWIMGGPLVWVVAAVFCAFGLTVFTLGAALHRAVGLRAESDHRRTSFMIEALTGITTIKAMTMERQMMRRYERLMDAASAASYRVIHLSAVSQALGSVFSSLAVAAVITYGALLVLDLQMTIGQLACCSLLAGSVMQPLLRATGIWTSFQAIRIAEAQIRKLHAYPQEPAGRRERGPLVTSGGIEFRNVGLGNPGGDLLLDNADLTIRPGECIAIIAADGTDRSAILSLIAGLARPTRGEILYDGMPLRETEPRPGPDEIGILPHEGEVFQGSLIDNLTTFRRGAAVDTALVLAERLGLDRYVASLPQGYETEISGGRTEALPGGVRQRIAVIRALVDQPRILLFDESNSGLDRDSNERFLRLLNEMKGRVTLVLASHQPAVLRLADRLLELRDGRFHERPPLTVPQPVAIREPRP